MNNNLKIKQNDNLIYQSKMKYSEPSYINLIFDKNFIFKTRDNIESKKPLEIRIEDEKGDYKHLVIFKNNNKMINAQYIDARKKIFKKINLDNETLKIDLQNIDEIEL